MEEMENHYTPKNTGTVAAEYNEFWPPIRQVLDVVRRSRTPDPNEQTSRKTGDVLLKELGLRLRYKFAVADVVKYFFQISVA